MFLRILNLRFIFTKIFLFYLFFKWLQIAFFQIKSYTSIIVSVLISIENFYLVEKQNKGNLICRFRIRENMRWAKFKRNHKHFAVFWDLCCILKIHVHVMRERKTKNEFCFNYFKFFIMKRASAIIGQKIAI